MNRLVATLVFLAIGLEARTQAYIDPGTGSLVVQAIIAAGLGTMYFFRRTLARVTGLFRKRPIGEVPPSPDDHQTE